MKAMDILEALTDMDDDLLLRAEETPPKPMIAKPKTVRHILAACLPLVLILTIWLTIGTTATKPKLRWTVRHRSYEVTWLFKDGVDFGDEDCSYEPLWIPEGYVFDRSYEMEAGRDLTYRSSDDDTKYFSFRYIHITDKETQHYSNLPMGSYETQTVEINGMPGEQYTYVKTPTSGMLLWIDETACVVFVLDYDDLTATQAQQIAKSVAPQ